MKSTETPKTMIKGTPKHEYAVLDGYYHVLVTVTEGGKISLKLDDRGILEYFFVLYGT